MTPARCPLVREIEEAAASCPHGWKSKPTEAQADAYYIAVDNCWYDRIRAALEAAEDVVRYTDARLADGLPLEYAVIDRAIQRYRAATRTEE